MTERCGATKLSSDAELISAVRSGDERAFGALYERHAEAARRLARQIVRRPADADDVVAETFARVLGAMHRGAGPSEAFRPYLLTVVRRVGYDQVRGQRDVVLTESSSLPDPGEFPDDPAVACLERSLVARAFRSLPERWSAVLWHTEVEQSRPAEVALLLGITPNGVAALSRRAREGLRQAYLQMHLSARTSAACSPAASKLGAYVRGGLSGRDTRLVGSHLRTCADCSAACAELTSINGSLRGIIGPLVLGGEAAAYFARAAHATTGMTVALAVLRRLIWPRPVLPVAAGMAVTAGLLPGATIGHIIFPYHASPVTMAPPAAAANPPAPVGRGGPPSRAGHHGPGPLRTPAPSPGSPSPSLPGLPSPPSGSPGGTSTLLAARLGVSVTASGPLNLGLVVVVTVRVSDPGTAATTGLVSGLSAPAGTVVLGLAGGSSGWTCSAGSSGTTSCTRPPIAAGATSSLAFRLLVVSLAGCGSTVTDTVTSGALSATGASSEQVQCLL